jgi:oligopeptide transport system substrate-binding protein
MRSALTNILLALAMVAGAVVHADSAAPVTLRRGNGPEPSTLDAHRAQDIASHNILRDLYTGLVTEGANGSIVPGIAERWDISGDALEYTFHLRPGLRWSNGEAMHATQIVASFQRALLPDTAAPLAPLLDAIRRQPDVPGSTGAAADIQAFDESTIRIRMTRPAPLLKLLALPVAMPVYLPAIAAHGNAHTRPGNLISNGAYILESWEPHSAITLVRNPHFFAAGEVAFDRARFVVTEDAASELKRFQAGDLDITETVPPGRLDRLRERFDDELRISPYLGSFFFGINLRAHPLGDSRALRQALSLAIDRDILTRYITALGETPAYGLVPDGIAGYTNARLPESALSQLQREAQARQLIAEVRQNLAEPLEVEIRYNTSTSHRRLSLAIAAMWRKTLGIQVRLRNEEWKSFVQSRRDGRITEIFRGGWIGDVDDPGSFLSLFDGAQALNWSGWNDARFVALLDAADRDSAQRMRLLQQAEQHLLDQHAIIPLYFYTSRHLVRAGIRGFEENLLDRHPTRWMSPADGEPVR